jgi:hypothetical protein
VPNYTKGEKRKKEHAGKHGGEIVEDGQRYEKGGFAPGNKSGNNYSKAARELREIFRKKVMDLDGINVATERLIKIIKSSNDENAAISAAKTLLQFAIPPNLSRGEAVNELPDGTVQRIVFEVREGEVDADS